MADNPIHPENNSEESQPIKIKSAEKKSDTARIDLASAKPPSGETARLDVNSAKSPKPDTTRIDTLSAKPHPSIIDKSNLPPDADDYFKRSTMRIDVTPGHGPAADGKKSDTTRIDIPPSASDAAKKKTSKIDLSAASSASDDVFKSKTIPVGIPTPPPASSGPLRPKTIQMKRPSPSVGESIIVSPESTASATEQARKSETARIDLAAEDADRPATRPKTIRIKRPDGTSGRKSLTISRPEEEAAAASDNVEEFASEEETPGTFVGIMAIAALLIAGVLLYVLVAQTLAPTLPFPGRIL